MSLERLEQDANGDLVYTFTHPWSDGTTGMRLAPLELLEKLAALVPLPRAHCAAEIGRPGMTSLQPAQAARPEVFTPGYP